MKLITSTITKVFLILLLLSCVNTSYSRLDEKAINDELVDIILGQFPHHGKAFYLNEIKVKEPLLQENPNDFELRNDIAVAYLKVEAWQEAQGHFDENEKRHPNKYKTHANLGVMYKKMGQYEKAAFHIKKSLKIKPEGHMGLGDYYLKMAQWLNNYEDDQKTNFLGISYDKPAQTAKAANKEYVITLIKNDYKFIDAYVVLGDILSEEKDYQLALRAYKRAQSLMEEKKFGQLAHKAYFKMTDISNKITNSKGFMQVADSQNFNAQLDKEIEDAEGWLSEFKKTEAELLHQKKVSFNDVRQRMIDKGITKPEVIEAITYKGFEYDPFIIPVIFLFLVIVSPIAFYFIYNKRRMKKLLRGTRKIKRSTS